MANTPAGVRPTPSVDSASATRSACCIFSAIAAAEWRSLLAWDAVSDAGLMLHLRCVMSEARTTKAEL